MLSAASRAWPCSVKSLALAATSSLALCTAQHGTAQHSTAHCRTAGPYCTCLQPYIEHCSEQDVAMLQASCTTSTSTRVVFCQEFGFRPCTDTLHAVTNAASHFAPCQHRVLTDRIMRAAWRANLRCASGLAPPACVAPDNSSSVNLVQAAGTAKLSLDRIDCASDTTVPIQGSGHLKLAYSTSARDLCYSNAC